MGAQGITTINFGTSLTGSVDASTTITGQTSILAGSLVEAWIIPSGTADHTIDEHQVDPPLVLAGNIVAGTGFTIYAYAPPSPVNTQQFADVPKHYGLWAVGWVWN